VNGFSLNINYRKLSINFSLMINYMGD